MDTSVCAGAQVILALVNNWESTGSADEIVGWAGFEVCAAQLNCCVELANLNIFNS